MIRSNYQLHNCNLFKNNDVPQKLLSFGSIRDDLNDKLRNRERIEQINQIRERLELCTELAEDEKLSTKFKAVLDGLITDVTSFVDKAVFWNTSIQVSKIYNWDYMKQKGPETILAANSNDMNSIPKTVCMVVVDVDNLKKVNTKYGTVLAGNEVVHHIAKALTLVFPDDIVTKFGGDEFFVLLKDTTVEETIKKAKQISDVIAENKPVFDDQEIPYTVSVGVCSHRGRHVAKDEEIGDLVNESKFNFKMLTHKAITACIEKAKSSKLKGQCNNIIVSNTADNVSYQYDDEGCVAKLELQA